ncbi:MAG: glycogen/starch/alpha-glucan phosphorylase [Thiobacillus sp.]|nr:glycogen/starch/alpha-glucan phosphorylase [Thiobacillus sp.]
MSRPLRLELAHGLGFFSTDRTMQEYNADIWKLK